MIIKNMLLLFIEIYISHIYKYINNMQKGSIDSDANEAGGRSVGHSPREDES